MPAYEFQTESGQVIEVVFSMSEAPAIGSVYEHPMFGPVTRIASRGQVGVNFTSWTYPYVSHSLPRNLPGCKTDRSGHPIIESSRHERNVASMHGYQKD